jgi:predicted DNA-binding protein
VLKNERKNKKLIIHLTPSMHQHVKDSAKRQGVSMAEYVRLAVERARDLEPVIGANIIRALGVPREY